VRTHRLARARCLERSVPHAAANWVEGVQREIDLKQWHGCMRQKSSSNPLGDANSQARPKSPASLAAHQPTIQVTRRPLHDHMRSCRMMILPMTESRFPSCGPASVATPPLRANGRGNGFVRGARRRRAGAAVFPRPAKTTRDMSRGRVVRPDPEIARRLPAEMRSDSTGGKI